MDMEYERRLADLRAAIEELKAQVDDLMEAAESPRVETGAAVEPVERPFTVAEQVVDDADAVKAGATACRSVEVAESGGLQQVYKFAGGGYAVTTADLSAENPPSPLPVFLVRMNCTVDGVEAVSVAYCTMQTLKDALGSGSGGESSGSGESSSTSGPWWELGGNAATCYGYAIGNALAEKVIDLAEKMLVGDWGVDGDLLVEGKATMTDGAANIVANPSLMDSDNQMQPRQVTFFVPGSGAGKLQAFKAWVMASAGVDEGSEQDLTPTENYLPEGMEIPGRVAYDETSTPKLVQYTLKWTNAGGGAFVEQAAPTTVTTLESHASQHPGGVF